MPVQRHSHTFDEYFSLRFGSNEDRRRIDTAERLKKKCLEEIGYLYIYKDERYVKETLIPELQPGTLMKLRLSDPKRFNDPSDSVFPDEYFLSYLRNDDQLRPLIDDPDPIIRTRIADLCAERRNALMATLGIRCFSEDPFLPRLWHCYADRNKGVCLEYSIDMFSGMVRNGYAFAYIFPVRYSDNPEDRLIEELRLPGTECLTEHQKNRQMACSVLTKAQCWSHEREWRWVMCLPHDSEEEIFRNQEICDGYRNKIFPLSPSRIYIGKEMNIDLENQLRSAAYHRNIPVQKVQQSDLRIG